MFGIPWICPLRIAVWLAIWVWLLGGGAWAQGVLNLSPGQGLVSGSESFRYGREFELPVVRFQFGFTTDELVRQGVIPDAFTVSIVDEQGGVAMILVTADAGGVVWAPLTPGTLPVNPEQMVWTPIPYSSLDPVQAPGLAQSVAFDLEFALSPELAERDLKVYFDLFSNDDDVASQAWYSQPVVVPEPSSVVLLALGVGALAWGMGRGRPGPRGVAAWWLALLIWGIPAGSEAAEPAEKVFRLNDVELTLAEVTPETAVYFRSMRLNRGLNVWNVEVTVSNRSDRTLHGPLVLLVDSQTGTPGPVGPDGLDDSQPRKGFYDLSGRAGDGILAPGESTAPRTLSLGRSGTAPPTLGTRVFAGRGSVVSALAVTRSLDEVGRPLPGAQLTVTGPGGIVQQFSDRVSGVASLGQGAGDHQVVFRAAGRLPVWRQQRLTSDRTTLLPNPRLPQRSLQPAVVTPLGGSVVSNTAGTLQIEADAGAVTAATELTLTPLTGQTLPGFLPHGWSPLAAFWLESSRPWSAPLRAVMRPEGPIGSQETAVLALWDEATLEWRVAALVSGRGTNPVSATLEAPGAYALVAPDLGPTAPPPAQRNAALPGSASPVPSADGLTAEGTVTPAVSPASVVPEAVTAMAEVVFRHESAPMPSGVLLRGEVTETYVTSGGGLRLTPQYEQFLVSYQRPGDADPQTLRAVFPMRPRLLFGPDQLEAAMVRMELLPEQPFDGQVLDAGGGQIGVDGVRVLAGSGRLTGPSALRLRRLDATIFTNLVHSGHVLVAAFDLTVDGSTVAGSLAAQLSGAPTNGLFVLARVLSDTGYFGLQPVERLQSDSSGNLASLEPSAGDRLPGLRGSGQFVLVRVEAPQGLVTGVARNGTGGVKEGMPVTLAGLPWLTLTDAEGRYQLVGPAGARELQVRDPRTGDSGLATVTVADPATPQVQDLETAPRGPRVASITPADGATRVPRVGSVVLHFNEAVNPATVAGAIEILRPDNGVVPASLTLNLANRIVTLSPATELAPNTRYRVRLAATIADPGGLSLEGPREFTFTTQPLSIRDTAAQLIIYEPGATNVPAAILDAIPAYEPGQDPSAIVVHGTPGVADPEVPVILVNESTGETATVLSRPDGSFSSLISGNEQDFVSATFVNLNGTRVYVPVSRQHFDNGFVGLYPQGGILEAVSDGGPVQVLVKPNAIPSRAKFRLKALNRAQILQATGGVTPDVGSLPATAMRMEFEGTPPREPIQISFPADLDAMGYPAGDSAREVAAVLARVRDTAGVTTFEVLDQMRFEPAAPAGSQAIGTRSLRPSGVGDERVGTFITALGFVPTITLGLVTPLVAEYIVMPMIVGSRPVFVKGVTQFLPRDEQAPTTGMLDGFSQGAVNAITDGFNSRYIVNPVPGAFVILRDVANQVRAAPGRLQPGNVHATSNADGTYGLVAPVAREKYLLIATHPGYADQPVEEVKASVDIGTLGAVFKRLIFHTPNAEDVPVRINVSHAPHFPAPDQPCEVQVSAFRGVGAPPDLAVRVLSLTNLVNGQALPLTALVVTNETLSNNGTTRLWRGHLVARQPLQAVLRVESDGRTTTYPIQFSGVIPPVISGPLPKPDTNDVHGPIVISSQPAEGGILNVSGRIRIQFNKPVDRGVESASFGVSLDGPYTAARPVLRLDAGQRDLEVQFAGLAADREYTLTLSGEAVRDLAGQPLDQRPSTEAPDSFRLSFRTAPVRNQPLPELVNGRGSVIRGQTLYVIDAASGGPSLLTYDIRDPGVPVVVQRDRLHGQPRDLLVIPQYAYRRRPNDPPVTNDLVVVVGGDLDTRIDDLGNVTGGGQYLSVFEVEDPARPRPVPLIPAAILSFRVGSAVSKVRWAAPHLVYQEFGSDIHQLALVHLQEMIIGFRWNSLQGEARAGRAGTDLNRDGDYVDEDEVVPIPEHPPVEFYGKKLSYVLNGTSQKILDFSPVAGGQLVGVTLTHGVARDITGAAGARLPPAYRTLGINLAVADPRDSVFDFATNAYPRWVTVVPSLVILSNGVPTQPMVALVSLQPDADGEQTLAILDISLPHTPRLINRISLSPELLGGALQSVRLREDGLLEAAGGQNLVLLDPAELAVTNVVRGQAHPAIAGFLPGAGAATRTLGHAPYGYRAMAESGRGSLIQTAPEFRFVSFPASPGVVQPAQLSSQSDEALGLLMQGLRPASAIPPARAAAVPRAEIVSDLDPPRPSAHFHVWVQAPGSAGEQIELGLESINHAGIPLANFGVGFAPVRAITSPAQEAIGQKPRPNCGAPIRSLPAFRMSNDPRSPYYNQYLSRPFALLANETLSASELERLRGIGDREILHGGAGLRAFLDPSQATNRTVGLFAARVDARRKRLVPVAGREAITLFHPYLMGDNPPPPGGYVALPATYGMVAAHSGEVRTEAADMELPSRRMPIAIIRSIGNQDSYEGPFGVGWDFNYNQRLTELDPLRFPLGLQMPLIVRRNRSESEIAGSQDLLLNTGQGKVIRFRWISTNEPPEYAEDPLVGSLEYRDRTSDYFLPAPGQGVFDLLVKFRDGRFERLTPAGVRYRYAPDGRLEMVMDRFPANRHVLEYDRNGWLVRIDDRSVRAPRHVDFGYYRMEGDPDFREGLDEVTEISQWEGKIRRLRNYAGGEVLFVYDLDGFLVRRDGVEVGGENGGFSGRAQTHYVYRNCRFAGVQVTGSGTPLFSAETILNSAGKPVATAGLGIGGSTGVEVPEENSAATVEGQRSAASLADGSKAEYEFDARGHPRSVRSGGARGAPAETVRTQNADGLLETVRHPEGNREVRAYDSQSRVFRSRGNLIRHEVIPGPRGGEGYVLEFSYDPRYNLKSGPEKNANGFVITHRLQPDGRETASVQHDAAGEDETQFNEYGQLVASTDHRGVHTEMTYDADTGFLQRQQSGDSTYEYEYDGSYAARLGRPSTLSLPEGEPVRMRYNHHLQPVERSRGGLRELTAYDEQGRGVEMTRHLGDGRTPVTRKEFDAKGFLHRVTTSGVEVDGGAETIEYVFTPDELSRVRAVKLPQGTLQEHEFDHRGNLIRRSIGDYVEEYEYDLNGNQTVLKQGGEVVRTTSFNGLDRPARIVQFTGTKEELLDLEYYPGGQTRSQVLSDPEFGVVERLDYGSIDALGREIELALGGGGIQPRYRYVYERNAVSEIGPLMTVRTAWNDAGHRILRETAIATEVFRPDPSGRVLQVEAREDGSVFTDTFTYNALDHLETHRDDLGPLYTYVSRADGKRERVTNARNQSVVTDHSALGERLRVRRADGTEFRYAYDSLRQPTYAGDPKAGHTNRYDTSTRLAASSQRDGALTTFTDFDGRRQPQTVTIPGGSASLRYDLKQRMTERTVRYQSTTYSERRTYDALNRARVVRYGAGEDPGNSAFFEYDPAGPLLSARFLEEGADFTVRYEYRDDRNRTGIRYPSGLVLTEDRDAAGRLLGISDGSGPILRATAWAGSQLPKRVEVGPMTTVHQYDARGRLRASRTTRRGDGAVLAHLRYEYDEANNLVRRQYLHRGGRTEGFEYDAGDRLSKAAMGGRPAAAGSPLEDPAYRREYSYDEGGLDYLTTVSTAPLGLSPPPFAARRESHDAFLLPGVVDGFDRRPADPMGNVQFALLPVRPEGAFKPEMRSLRFVHDGDGHLVQVVRDDGLVVDNAFQPDGLRYRRRTTQGGRTLDARHFVYDSSGRLLEEYDVAGATPFLSARYLYATGDSPQAADLHDLPSGTLRRHYFLRDVMESVVAVVDDAGRVVERAWHDPFGQSVIEAADAAAPELLSIGSEEGGALRIVLSEPVMAVLADPGEGVGVVPVLAPDARALVQVTVNSAPVEGTVEWIPGSPDVPPYSRIRFTPSSPIPATPSGVLGWWPGDAEVSEVIAGNRGLLRGGASVGPGLNQQAFLLRGGGGYVEVTNSAAFALGTGDFTVAAWVRFHATAGEQVVLEKWVASSRAGWSLSRSADRRLRFLAGASVVESEPLALGTNLWFQVAARRQGNQVTLFTNGVAVASGPVTGPVSSPTTLKFGSREGTSAFLVADLDEITLHARALSDAELGTMAGGVSLPGPVTVTLVGGVVADEWGNLNAGAEVAFLPVDAPGDDYFRANPEPATAAPVSARSTVGSPFQFHGQFVDYDTGLLYLRARFYDPFTGMFLEPDPAGYEDSVNLYAAMANNPVGHRDPSGLNFLRWLVGRVARFGGRHADEVAHVVPPTSLGTYADGVSQSWVTERAFVSHVEHTTSPLTGVERIGKYTQEMHGLTGADRPVVLGLEMSKDGLVLKYDEVGRLIEEIPDPSSVRYTSKLLGGEHFMNSKKFQSDVDKAIEGGRKFIVDVSNMAGKTLAAKVENAIARQVSFLRNPKIVRSLPDPLGPGEHYKFMTDWEMYRLWESGLLGEVTFVQRFGDDIYELANPFAKAVTEVAEVAPVVTVAPKVSRWKTLGKSVADFGRTHQKRILQETHAFRGGIGAQRAVRDMD